MKKDIEKLKTEIKKIGKYKAMSINTGFGSKEYTIMINVGGGEYISSRPTKYFKTEAGVLREIKKKMKSLLRRKLK